MAGRTILSMAIACGLALGAAGSARAHHPPDSAASNEVQKQSGSFKDMDLKSLSSDQAMQLQRKLTDKGFYRGKINGVIDRATYQAFHDFQRSVGVEASDRLDIKTADALGVTFQEMQPVRGSDQTSSTTPASGGKTSTAPVIPDAGNQAQGTSPYGGVVAPGDTTGSLPTEGSNVEPQAGREPLAVYDPGTVRDVQRKLKSQHLFKGTVTGTFDQKTRAAVTKFQKRHDLADTGDLDKATLAALGVIGPAAVPSAIPSATPYTPQG